MLPARAQRIARLFGGPFHVDHEGGVEQSIDWYAELLRLLDRRTVAPAQLRIYRSGAQVHGPQEFGAVERRGKTRRRVLDELEASPATIVLDGVDQISVATMTLTDEVARIVGHPVSTSLFYSSGPDQGFVSHRDPMPVVIWQVLGSKRWNLHEGAMPTSMHTSDRRLRSNIGASEQSVVLTEGDLLHVPAGQPHSVEVVSGPTLHLSFASRLATVTDWIRWASTDPEINQVTSTTITGDAERAALDAAFASLAASAQDLSAFWRYRAARARVRGRSHLPLEFLPAPELAATQFRCSFRALPPTLDSIGREAYRISWNESSIVLHTPDETLAAKFASGAPVFGSLLVDAFRPTEPSPEEALRSLLAKGMVEPC